MQVARRYRPAIFAIAMGLVLAGCGQKGPLYRDAGTPDAQTENTSEWQSPASR